MKFDHLHNCFNQLDASLRKVAARNTPDEGACTDFSDALGKLIIVRTAVMDCLQDIDQRLTKIETNRR